MFGEFYKKTFKNGGICDFDIEYPDVRDAVKAIKQAGGKAVLAHPGQQQNFDLIDVLYPLGLDGVEYNHPENSESDRQKIKTYSDKYHLFLTGGSDYHGIYDVDPKQIGQFLSDESGVWALCR
jgi:predicted metal-dependent phosphoesterase TrpH